jgi:hypothetical protein
MGRETASPTGVRTQASSLALINQEDIDITPQHHWHNNFVEILSLDIPATFPLP